MSTPLRWGIIGTGGIARTFASDLVYLDGDAEVVAVGSRSQASADAFAVAHGVARAYDTYDALVRDEDVDVVYVATPHPMHFANASLALRHGKPVLVEKAFTMTGAEARELVELARAKDLFMMEAMWTRFLPHVLAMKDLVEQGVLGELVVVEADHGQWFERDSTSRLFDPALGGGAMLDLGVYPVSFASMFLGRPTRVVGLVDAAFTGVDGQASMLFGYDSGAQAVLTCTLSARSATRACVTGTRARLEVEGDFYAPSSFTLITREGQRERKSFTHEGRGLYFEAAEVARCLREGLTESPRMALDESVAIIETMESVLNFLVRSDGIAL